MIALFRILLARLVAFGLELAAALIKGILGSPVTAMKRLDRSIEVGLVSATDVRDLRLRVLRPGRPAKDAEWEGDTDPDTRHFAARHDGRIVGVATVLRKPCPDGDPQWQLRGMAVAPEWQGQRIGARLLAALEAEIGEPLWCNARSTAVEFYRKAGWREVGEPFDIAGVGPHKRMTRYLG